MGGIFVVLLDVIRFLNLMEEVGKIMNKVMM